jgi:signal transduction histidine kinase
MKQRSKAGGKAGKSARHKAATPKRRLSPPKALPSRRSATTQQETEIARLTRERDDALARQNATTEVLRVTTRSKGELQPVFESILANAAKVCHAKFGHLLVCEGDAFRNVAMYDAPTALAEKTRDQLFRPHPESPLAEAAVTRRPVQVHDLTASRPYLDGHPAVVMQVELGGTRTLVAVPMLNESKVIGVIILYRNKVHAFTEKQIELVENFAAQAVIAIENARLLNELRQSLEQQTATSEVLGVISRSRFELQPVLQSVVDTAARLCRAKTSGIFRLEGGAYRLAAVSGLFDPPAYLEHEQQALISPGPGTIVGRAAMDRQVVQIEDAWSDPLYEEKENAKLGGVRSMIGVPLMREGEPIGVIGLARTQVEPFVEREVDLVRTFADQAVVAIENARLLNELRQRTDDLTQSLEDLRAMQDRLVQTQKLASLGQLTAGIAHEIKNPLNFVNNFSGISAELIDELQEALRGVQADEKTRSEIGELADTLRDNLGKIVQHGRRADAIVKNMLLHSREGSGEHRPVDVNGLVEEALTLAYHGVRAEKQDFTITLQRSFDPETGQADVFPQDITRVLLNVISNGFYAAAKRKDTMDSEGFEPTVSATTRNLGDRVEIGIRDNGTGISPEVKEKIFNPFFTTKPAGEGTGLGLSISYDIVVKQHAGSIEIDTQPGEFTEIRIILPRSTAHLSSQRT